MTVSAIAPRRIAWWGEHFVLGMKLSNAQLALFHVRVEVLPKSARAELRPLIGWLLDVIRLTKPIRDSDLRLSRIDEKAIIILRYFYEREGLDQEAIARRLGPILADLVQLKRTGNIPSDRIEELRATLAALESFVDGQSLI